MWWSMLLLFFFLHVCSGTFTIHMCSTLVYDLLSIMCGNASFVGVVNWIELNQLLYTQEQIWYDGCATQVHIDHISVWAHPQKECILCPEWHVEWRLYRSYILYAGERSIGSLYIAVCSLTNLIIVYYMYRIPPVERDVIPIISQRGGQH